MSTLNYIGSKFKLFNTLDIVIGELIKQFNNPSFLDGFSGSCILSKLFNRKYNINTTANDIQYYSYIIGYALLKVPYNTNIGKHIIEMNKLTKPINADDYSLITNNYTELNEYKRTFWTIENANKADACMEYINTKVKSNKSKIFLKASLISSLDKVANTTSVYGAFKKTWKSSSIKTLDIKPIHIDKEIKGNNEINCEDIIEVVKNNKYDIAYFDPPYNTRQYSSNYHPLEYISKYDKNIIIYGKTGLIKDYIKSNFSTKSNVIDAFKKLIQNTNANYICISYNNEGIANDTIEKELIKKGETILYKIKYRKFKSQKEQNNEDVFEYLYVCNTNIKHKNNNIIIQEI